MVIEADFVPGVATTKAAAITDYNVFEFPSIGGSKPSVVGAGDIVVMFKDSPASRALVTYLASPAAATIAAKYAPGYSSPNKNVKPSAYSDVLNRATAIQLAHAKTFRFDLSDLAAVRVRRDGRSGRVQAVPGLRQDPLRRERDRRAAGGGREEGLQVSRG